MNVYIMGRTLYLECNAGISGDMTVAALLDAGGSEEALRRGLESLGVGGYHLHTGRTAKAGIGAMRFAVHLEDQEGDGGVLPHTHAEHDHSHDHGHAGGGHTHSHGEHTHEGGRAHHHRNLWDILSLIGNSALSDRAKELAEKTFRIVAEAEARVHGLPVEEVHFHEVGAVDSIVDIVGAAILVDNLGVDRVACTPLSEGQGVVRCQHGVMPVPAPATMEILRRWRLPFVITDNDGEMVTPTGAAIVAALAESFEPPRNAALTAVGYGAGTRDFAVANVLRASLWEDSASDGADTVTCLECNLDDMTGEELARACELLLEAGALDVWCTPVTMKKSRPAQQLSVLLPPELEKEMVRLLFLHTTTIGLRRCTQQRHVMERRPVSLETPYGPVEAKESRYGEICKIKIEYESAKELSDRCNVPIREIVRGAFPSKN